VASWSVTIDVERGEAEEVAAALMEEGAGGVEVRDGEGVPMPGVRQPAAGRALVVAWFAGRDEAAAAAASAAASWRRCPTRTGASAGRRGSRRCASAGSSCGRAGSPPRRRLAWWR